MGKTKRMHRRKNMKINGKEKKKKYQKHTIKKIKETRKTRK
jgi:hypothetical protein